MPNNERYAIFSGSEDFTVEMRVCSWGELRPLLEGCEFVVQGLGVGDITAYCPMSYVVRLKDAE